MNRTHLNLEALEGRSTPALFVVDVVGDDAAAEAAGQTLREAIIAANGAAGEDTVTFAEALNGSPIVLSAGGAGEDAAATGDLDITDDLIITGNGRGETVIDAGGIDRAFHAVGGTVLIEGVTIRNGSADGDGGGLLVESASDLTARDVTITGNTASGDGGGIALPGGGTAAVVNATVSDNVGADGGGGAFVDGGASLDLVSSTVSGNTANGAGGFPVGYGGGVAVFSGRADVTNSTVSNNTANGYGGGGIAAVGGSSEVTVTQSTITGNTVPIFSSGGVYATYGGSATITNSIIAGNGNDLDSFFDGTFVAEGVNIIITQTNEIDQQNGTLITDSPMLGALQDNGGPNPTQAPMEGSPALDAGDTALVPADEFDLDGDGDTAEPIPFDGRGGEFGRVSNGTVDIGAFEQEPPNTPPEITSDGGGDGASVSITEDTTAVTAVAATDADGDTPTFAIAGGDDGALFTIDADTGELAFTEAPDFENPDDADGDNVYVVAVRADDGNGGTDEQTIAVTVTDINTGPSVEGAGFEAPEDAANGAVLGTLTFSDPDGDPVTFAITAGDDGGVFAVSDAGVVTVANSAGLDFEAATRFTLTVTASDLAGLTDDAEVTVDVTDVNEAPSVTPATFPLDENSAAGTEVGAVAAADPDAADTPGTLTYSVAGTTFAIDPATGVLTVADPAALNFEATRTFAVEVTVTDRGGLAGTATVTVNLNNVNEPPSLEDETLTTPESANVGLGLTIVRATDSDAGETFTYEITGGDDGGRFAFGDNGLLLLAAPLDFESRPEFTLTVTATDTGGLTADAVITVQVQDANEAPSVTDATFTVPASVAAGDAIGTVAASDPDAGDTFTLAITDGDAGGVFAVDAATGELAVADPAGLTPGGTFTLTVGATDADGLTGTGTITVEVGEVVNIPPTAGDDTFGVGPDSPTPLDVLANDSDPDGDALTIALVGPPAGGTAEAADGQIVYAPAQDFRGDDAFTYTVADGRGGTATATVSVTVSDTAPPPPPPPGGEPAPSGPVFAVGAGPGGTNQIQLFGDGGAPAGTSPSFFGVPPGGVRVATADVNGDGTPDVIAGTGPGGPTLVRVIDGETGAELFAVAPFEASFTGGVFVAAGDFDADGQADIVITPDEGGGPRARIFSGATGGQLGDFFGIEDPDFRGGARAAAGDFDGDGVDDLIVAAGFDGGPRVSMWGGASVAAGTPAKLTGDFFVFEDGLRNGAFVAAGDVDGDGVDDLIAGGGPGGAPRVRAFGGAALAAGGFDAVDPGLTPGVQLANFFAGPADDRGGVRVAARNLDGDALAEVMAGTGPGPAASVTVFAGAELAAGGPPTGVTVTPFGDDFTGGVFVG